MKFDTGEEHKHFKIVPDPIGPCNKYSYKGTEDESCNWYLLKSCAMNAEENIRFTTVSEFESCNMYRKDPFKKPKILLQKRVMNARENKYSRIAFELQSCNEYHQNIYNLKNQNYCYKIVRCMRKKIHMLHLILNLSRAISTTRTQKYCSTYENYCKKVVRWIQKKILILQSFLNLSHAIKTARTHVYLLKKPKLLLHNRAIDAKENTIIFSNVSELESCNLHRQDVIRKPL